MSDRIVASDRAPLEVSRLQRTHVLFVLSDARPSQEAPFHEWYANSFCEAVRERAEVLSAQAYEQDEVDIDQGGHPPLPFRYLTAIEIVIDGAEAAQPLIERIGRLHAGQSCAKPPATWLYYPVSEKVGRPATERPSLLTLAFANPVHGKEAEFREWYATRHIRHALHIPALVSGQCLERSQFQRPGALDARFHTIAVYEQEGTPESIIEAFNSLPESALHFPALDLSSERFSEWVYRPLARPRAP